MKENKFLEHFQTLINKSTKTIEEIEQEIEIPKKRLLEFYNGFNTPNEKEFIKLAHYFDVKMDYLFGLQDKNGNLIIRTPNRSGYVI